MVPYEDILRRVLHYDPLTGLITAAVDIGRRAPAGSVMGNYDKDGYLVLQVAGRKFKAGRVAWLLMTGKWPVEEVDHEDGVRDNNIWTNLREATRRNNVINTKRATGVSGLRGVMRDSKNPTLWRARITYRNYQKWLGPFKSPEEASVAYLVAAEQIHGEFALHNRPSLRRL